MVDENTFAPEATPVFTQEGLEPTSENESALDPFVLPEYSEDNFISEDTPAVLDHNSAEFPNSIAGGSDTVAASLPKAFLIDDKDGRRFPLHKQLMTIGRHPTCDIILPHGGVVRSHAQIVIELGRFVIHDLSDNVGTWVNEQLINQVILESGDTIQIGEANLFFEIEGVPSRSGEYLSASKNSDGKKKSEKKGFFGKKFWFSILVFTPIIASSLLVWMAYEFYQEKKFPNTSQNTTQADPFRKREQKREATTSAERFDQLQNFELVSLDKNGNPTSQNEAIRSSPRIENSQLSQGVIQSELLADDPVANPSSKLPQNYVDTEVNPAIEESVPKEFEKDNSEKRATQSQEIGFPINAPPEKIAHSEIRRKTGAGTIGDHDLYETEPELVQSQDNKILSSVMSGQITASNIQGHKEKDSVNTSIDTDENAVDLSEQTEQTFTIPLTVTKREPATSQRQQATALIKPSPIPSMENDPLSSFDNSTEAGSSNDVEDAPLERYGFSQKIDPELEKQLLDPYSEADVDPFKSLVLERFKQLEEDQKVKSRTPDLRKFFKKPDLDMPPTVKSSLNRGSNVDSGSALQTIKPSQPIAQVKKDSSFPLAKRQQKPTEISNKQPRTTLSSLDQNHNAQQLINDAKQLYKEGKISALMESLKQVSQYPELSSEIQQSIIVLEKQYKSLNTEYLSGKKELDQGNRDEAFRLWKQYLQSEKVIYGKQKTYFSRYIRATAATEYRQRAEIAKSNQQFAKAYRYWSTSNRLMPSVEAEQSLASIESKAGLVAERATAIEGQNNQQARTLWQEVTQLLPQTHNLHKRAQRKLDALPF